MELRAGGKGGTEEELETTLDKALMLFRYISVSFPRPVICWDGGGTLESWGCIILSSAGMTGGTLESWGCMHEASRYGILHL